MPDDLLWTFSLQKHSCNVAHPVGETRNRLLELLHGWFGPDAGKPGTQYHVQFKRGKDGWTIRPLGLGLSESAPLRPLSAEGG